MSKLCVNENVAKSTEMLDEALQNRRTRKALEIIRRDAISCRQSGQNVLLVLLSDNAEAIIIDAALGAYFQSEAEFKNWVYGFLHFSSFLWEKRRMDWLKRFYHRAYERAAMEDIYFRSIFKEVVDDFVRHATSEDCLSDFFVNPDVLRNWDLEVVKTNTVITQTFGSRRNYVAWQARNIVCYSEEGGKRIPEKMLDLVVEMKSNDLDMGEFSAINRDWLLDEMVNLESKMPIEEGLQKQSTLDRLGKIRQILAIIDPDTFNWESDCQLCEVG